MALQKAEITCPYCWEEIEVIVDPTTEGQSYVEDCSICCHPMVLTIHGENEDGWEVSAAKENE